MSNSENEIEQVPEELQRRPDASYMQEIQSKKEQEAAAQATQTKVWIGAGLALVIALLFLVSRLKRRVK